MANPVGPPTKYRPAMLKKIREYLDNYTEPDYKWHDVIPTEATVRIMLGLCKDTILSWKRDGEHPELTALLTELRARQERAILNGRTENIHFGINKLLLTNVHGYKDKVEQDVKVSNVVTTEVMRYDGTKEETD